MLSAGCINSLHAQLPADTRERVILSLKAGINLSNVYDSDGDAFIADGKVGFAGGAALAIPFNRFVGLQPEVLVSQKGFYATGKLGGNFYDIKRTTNYLDVPLFFTLKPLPVITIMAGPQYSYLMSQTNTFANASTTIATEAEFGNENYRRHTVCAVAGVDVNLWHLVLGARAGFDLASNNRDASLSTPRYKNVWYQLTAGFRIYRHG